MNSINSLVGRAPTTFLSSSGPTNTWLDDYIDNPTTLEYIPERDGPAVLERIPNYIPGLDTGVTPLIIGQQRMAGMNPILRTIVNYVNDLNSGKYNHTQYKDNDYMGNYAVPFNPLETKWNYRNMPKTLNSL